MQSGRENSRYVALSGAGSSMQRVFGQGAAALSGRTLACTAAQSIASGG